MGYISSFAAQIEDPNRVGFPKFVLSTVHPDWVTLAEGNFETVLHQPPVVPLKEGGRDARPPLIGIGTPATPWHYLTTPSTPSPVAPACDQPGPARPSADGTPAHKGGACSWIGASLTSWTPKLKQMGVHETGSTSNCSNKSSVSKPRAGSCGRPAPVCPSDSSTQPEHTAVTAAVTSIGRAVDQALVGVGRRITACRPGLSLTVW